MLPVAVLCMLAVCCLLRADAICCLPLFVVVRCDLFVVCCSLCVVCCL